MSCPSLLPQYKTAEMPNIAAMDDFPEPEYLEGAAPTPHECTRAMLAHLGGLLLSFIPPAILMVTQQDKSHFVFRHAREAVNHQITRFFYLLVISMSIAGVAAAFYLADSKPAVIFMMGTLVAIFLLAALIIIELFLMVRACMAAAKGQEFRYPLTIRLI